MEKMDKDDISKIVDKMGKFIVIGVFIQVLFSLLLINPLVKLVDGYGPLSKYDPLEINAIIRSFTYSLSLILIAKYTFVIKIKDMFLKNNQVDRLSLKAKIKLTLLFMSIQLFSVIVSSFLMIPFNRYVMPIDMPETTLLLSIFGIFVAPIIEEIIFRGVVLNQFKDIGYLFAVIISSIYFGAMHGIGFVHASILGIISGFAYVLTGNIRWSIIIHFIYNLTINLIGYLFMPLSSIINYYIGMLIIIAVLFLIFLVTSIKDDEIKELRKKVNIKYLINQFKKDKEKYSIFINEPVVIISIVVWIFIQLIPLHTK